MTTINIGTRSGGMHRVEVDSAAFAAAIAANRAVEFAMDAAEAFRSSHGEQVFYRPLPCERAWKHVLFRQGWAEGVYHLDTVVDARELRRANCADAEYRIQSEYM